MLDSEAPPRTDGRSALRRAIHAFDRPPLRGILGLAATAAASAVNRRIVSISYRHGYWFSSVNRTSFPRDRAFDFYRYDIERIPKMAQHFEDEARDCWFWRYHPQKGDTIVDVGAGIGTDTVYFSRAVGAAGRVVAIEAAPSTYRRLLATCKANRLTNVDAVSIGVSDKTGHALIDERDNDVASALTGAGGTRIPCDTLDNILAPISRIDLLKMNIEGAERLAIQGMTEVAKKTRCIAVASHDFRADTAGNEWFRTKALVADWMRANGFSVEGRSDKRIYVNDHIYGAR